MAGRISTPAPEAWRRRRTVCRVGPVLQRTCAAPHTERNQRSCSLPTRCVCVCACVCVCSCVCVCVYACVCVCLSHIHSSSLSRSLPFSCLFMYNFFLALALSPFLTPSRSVSLFVSRFSLYFSLFLIQNLSLSLSLFLTPARSFTLVVFPSLLSSVRRPTELSSPVPPPQLSPSPRRAWRIPGSVSPVRQAKDENV